MTKLSIIIPVYNEGRFLKRCLDSIRTTSEHLPDLEIIAINDGSTDNSREILDRFEFNILDVKVIHHATNWGVSMTRNHGLSLAKGDFVTFLDADDELTGDGVDHLLTGCLADFDILQFNHIRAYEQGFSFPRYSNEPGRYYLGENLPQKWVLCWNKIYKRSFLSENRITFPESVSFEEDRIFNIRALRRQSMIYCGKANTVIKHNDNKASLCHSVGREQIFSLTQALMRELKDEDNSPELERLIRKCIANVWNSPKTEKIFGGKT